MAKIICVLYDDPVDWLSQDLRPRRDSRHQILSRRPDAADAQGDRFQARRTARQRLRRPRPAEVGQGQWPHAGRHLRQGRRQFDARQGAARRRDRHLAALLAGLHDGRAHRQGAQTQADRHGRHRLRPHRSASRHQAQDHRRRSHLLQQHQRRRARGDDDPGLVRNYIPSLSIGSSRRAGTSPIASSAPTTSKA